MDKKRNNIRSFVLRSGRLSPSRKAALEKYSTLYCLELSDGRIDRTSVYGNNKPLIVEIGFGAGRATVELAERFEQYNFLGIEVYLPGVGRVLREIHSRSLDNLRVIRGDAMEVVRRMLPGDSVYGVHIFFPDPWPKKKHHKRRLFQKEFVHLLAQRLQPDGYIYAVTDWEEYAQQMLDVVAEEKLLKNPYGGPAPAREWRPRTSFEGKGIEKNHKITEVWAVRSSGETVEECD